MNDIENCITRIRSNSNTLGTFCSVGSSITTEICAASGLDWLLVDLEHGTGREKALSESVLAGAAYDKPVLARVEANERIRIGRVLDLGAAGVMVPRVKGLEDAQLASDHMEYQPNGNRGVATYNRACKWGLAPELLFDTNKTRPILSVQIENLEALESVEAIATLPAVDLLFVGPLDLSFALQTPGNFDSEIFQEALTRVVRAAQNSGKSAGIMAGTTELAKSYYMMGFSFISLASDATTLASAYKASVESLRKSRIL